MLIPAEPKEHGKFEQAASVEYAQFDPIASIILPQLESKLDGYDAIIEQATASCWRCAFVSSEIRDNAVGLMKYSCRRSPSQIYSIYRIAALLLSTSNWGVWNSVQISRGKWHIRIWRFGISNTSTAGGGKASHTDHRGRNVHFVVVEAVV